MPLGRSDWLAQLATALPDGCLVMSTYIGAVSFEWAHHTNEHPRTGHLGQMGDVIGLALGLALTLPHRKVVCLDGDGSVLMELGQLVAMGQHAPDNLVVFVVDNGVYESIGWGDSGRRVTATAGRANLASIAASCGVPYTVDISTQEQFDTEIELAFSRNLCSFLNVRTEPGHSRVEPRRTDGIEDKYRFVRYVERLEDILITGVPPQDLGLMEDQSPG
ncbi:MAG: thiamine pyrophosphate-dependent enzyme [Acidimicrobiales bacterium]|jgi:thiamine pyrophosphate-dependent acetolactate synthase large subunit-like protein|nr:thiamine pyrophosphate-dependent enzyme [Acidimicrobiales bacterium]MDP7092602.1 thiamine pyrophosphate-dependent enzyme [Candidatus Thalassarchaeaceae archaeon]